MKPLHNILTALSLLFLFSCASKSINCDKINKPFASYEDALKQVKGSIFTIQENLNTSKSSWIRKASFYSCDKKEGYFIMGTDKQEYMYYIPVEVWEELKEAESLGVYYDNNIRRRYKLYLNES